MGLNYRTPLQRLSLSSERSQLIDSSEITQRNIEISEATEILDLDTLIQLMREKQVVIFDVRPEIFFKLGHIPGAYLLQEKKFESDLAVVKSVIENAITKRMKIAIYCSGIYCPDAGKVAKALHELGYKNLMIFEGGWEAWQLAGMEEEKESL